MRVFIAVLLICSIIGVFPIDLLAKNPTPKGLKNPDLRHCSMGEARAALEGLENGIIHWNPFEGEETRGGLGAFYDCQYRLWSAVDSISEKPWTFCEEDHFLGGTASAYPFQKYPFCSLTGSDCTQDKDCPANEYCADTLGELDKIFKEDNRTAMVLFGPDGGILEEQVMLQTPTKNAHDPIDGNIAWNQTGFITQQSPGIYRSEFQPYFNGVPDTPVTVLIEVVSHEEHVKRAANGIWK